MDATQLPILGTQTEAERLRERAKRWRERVENIRDGSVFLGNVSPGLEAWRCTQVAKALEDAADKLDGERVLESPLAALIRSLGLDATSGGGDPADAEGSPDPV